MNPWRASLEGRRQVGFRIAVALPPSPIVRHGHASVEPVLRFGCETDPIPEKMPLRRVDPGSIAHGPQVGFGGPTPAEPGPRRCRAGSIGQTARDGVMPGSRDPGPSALSRPDFCAHAQNWAEQGAAARHTVDAHRRSDAQIFGGRSSLFWEGGSVSDARRDGTPLLERTTFGIPDLVRSVS